MSFKQEKVSMPMSSAGIVGFSSDMKLAGVEIEPKFIIVGALVLIVIVKAADIILK
jgi:preprotein translocase subunit Sec61beta